MISIAKRQAVANGHLGAFDDSISILSYFQVEEGDSRSKNPQTKPPSQPQPPATPPKISDNKTENNPNLTFEDATSALFEEKILLTLLLEFIMLF